MKKSVRTGPYAPPADDEPATEIVLSVSIRGQFEASVRVPLSEAPNFDKHVSRWLELMHVALRTNVEEMQATLER